MTEDPDICNVRKGTVKVYDPSLHDTLRMGDMASILSLHLTSFRKSAERQDQIDTLTVKLLMRLTNSKAVSELAGVCVW